MDELESEIDDLCALEIGNGKDLLQELRIRYRRDKIYTFAGDVLLVINPFKRLPSPAKLVPSPRGEWQYPAPAHISSVAKRAFRAMCRTKKSQCCITTGVSGSGKTESSKSLIRHVLSLSTAANRAIKERILQIDPVFEAFGNASTSLNRNSSRFCKYFEMLYNTDQRLVGGQLSHYMLEKTRVTIQEQGETNFHVFYYLLYGAEDEMLLQFSLNPSNGYRYMCSDLQPKIDASVVTESKRRLHSLVHSMAALGMDPLETNKILRSVAAILHLGEIGFTVEPLSGSTVITDKEAVKNASSLLEIAPKELEMMLLTNAVVAGESMHITSCKTTQQAVAARNAIAETLYSALFNLIVWRINQFLIPQESNLRTPDELQIDFLDIFGFQQLQTNSLEQFCVNMANEQLTYFYNQYVLAWEQHEYRNEGIRLKPVKFMDNTKTVDLLMNRGKGLLSLLDEDTRSYKGDDIALLKKFSSKQKKNPAYSAPKSGQDKTFTVQHYAGAVTYVASQFLFKNGFGLSSSIVRCMKGSRDTFVKMLFQAKISRTGSFGHPHHRNTKHDALTKTGSHKKKKKKLSGTVRRKASVVDHLSNDSKTAHANQITTVGSIFRNSLSEIMENILKSTCHFVRCIKPNQYQATGHFDDDFILSQLRHCGVLETIFILRFGYPVRLTFANFIERYRMLSYPLLAAVKDTAGSCHLILTRSQQASAGWTIGKTKVFLKYWCANILNSMVDRTLHGIVSLQKVFRGRRTRIFVGKMKYQQRLEKQFVGNFLTQIIDQGGSAHKSLSLQTAEDDVREETKRNTQKAVVPMTPERRSILQVNATGSAEGINDRASPVHSLHQRDSNLSVTSVESVSSTVSVEGDDVDASLNAWCEVTCYERELQRAKFTIDRPSFAIDGSDNTFDVTRIGLSALPIKSGDSIVAKVRSCVQKGVKIFQDDEFNVWAERLSKNPVFVKGRHVGSEAKDVKGELPRKKALMIFDYNAFVHRLQSDCSLQTFTSEREPKIMSSVCVYVSFVTEGNVDSETPCWVGLVVLQAKRQAQGSIISARHQRKQLQKKKYEKTAAVSKSNVGRSRQAAAVNALPKQIRPGRHIDSFRFGRKNWARKKVATDPFSFGKEGKGLEKFPQDTAKGNAVSTPTMTRDENLGISGDQLRHGHAVDPNANLADDVASSGQTTAVRNMAQKSGRYNHTQKQKEWAKMKQKEKSIKTKNTRKTKT